MSLHLGYSSVMRRVLEIPEIIEQILSYLENKEKLAIAPVCKRWADIALNLVWRKMDNIITLFLGLAPMVPNDDLCYVSCVSILSVTLI